MMQYPLRGKGNFKGQKTGNVKLHVIYRGPRSSEISVTMTPTADSTKGRIHGRTVMCVSVRGLQQSNLEIRCSLCNHLVDVPDTTIFDAICTELQFQIAGNLPSLPLNLLASELVFNFSTPCMQNVNNTGTKYVRIMKQTAFWRGKNEEYIPCLKYSVLIFVE